MIETAYLKIDEYLNKFFINFSTVLVSPVPPLPFCDALVKGVLVFYTVGILEYRMPFADFEV